MKKVIDYAKMGSRIRAQREALGYTREQFSEKIDRSTKFCADIELGIKGISIETLMRISEVLHLSTDYILFGYTTKSDSIKLINKCPEKARKGLFVIIKTFIDSVKNDEE